MATSVISKCNKLTYKDITIPYSSIDTWADRGGLYRANLVATDWFGFTPSFIQVIGWNGNILVFAQLEGAGELIQLVAEKVVPTTYTGGVAIRGFRF